MRTILIAALFSLPLVAAGTTQTLAANYGSSASGGGSAGYNRGVATDYRLKKHHASKKLHNQVKPKKTSAKSAKPKS
jgi:gamma-glutamyltranspeptidase